jgi:hypothetical protein
MPTALGTSAARREGPDLRLVPPPIEASATTRPRSPDGRSRPAAAGAASGAAWILEHEARALLTRLERVKPFALQETMVAAAALLPEAQIGIERHLLDGRRTLREQVRSYVHWLRGPGRTASPEEMQKRFTLLRLRFNAALSQLDLFAEAIGQRSEHETGVWLAGLDVAAQDAIRTPEAYFDPPPIVCHLHRGLGGAIRRARTRLPGGGVSPVAIVRIPRERMIGYGIASSLVHEVGHQAAALLGLVEALRPAIQKVQGTAPEEERPAWDLWERWISEILADLWALAKVGIASTLGLVGIVSLPRWFVFRAAGDDPHPFPWIRVRLSCAIGDALYPHPQWRKLAAVWSSFYPPGGLDPERAKVLEALLATLPSFVALLMNHRPESLRGDSLGEALRLADRDPEKLEALFERWRSWPEAMKEAPPTLVFAAFGRARAAGRLTPERESRLLGDLITHWALRSTLRVAASCASAPDGMPRPAHPGVLRPIAGPNQGQRSL